jgi:hypothetical protein
VAGLNQTTRGLLILVARLTARKHERIFSLCHYFARVKQLWENESCHEGNNEMAGLKGKSGPPGNMNAFKHGLAAIQKMARGRHSNRARGERPKSVHRPMLAGSSIRRVF